MTSLYGFYRMLSSLSLRRSVCEHRRLVSIDKLTTMLVVYSMRACHCKWQCIIDVKTHWSVLCSETWMRISIGIEFILLDTVLCFCWCEVSIKTKTNWQFIRLVNVKSCTAVVSVDLKCSNFYLKKCRKYRILKWATAFLCPDLDWEHFKWDFTGFGNKLDLKFVKFKCHWFVFLWNLQTYCSEIGTQTGFDQCK